MVFQKQKTFFRLRCAKRKSDIHINTYQFSPRQESTRFYRNLLSLDYPDIISPDRVFVKYFLLLFQNKLFYRLYRVTVGIFHDLTDGEKAVSTVQAHPRADGERL